VIIGRHHQALAMVQLDQEVRASGLPSTVRCSVGTTTGAGGGPPDALDTVLATVKNGVMEKRVPPRSPGGGHRLGSERMEDKVIEEVIEGPVRADPAK